MKRVIYFVLFVTSVFFLGCSDSNVLTPEIVNPNQDWELVQFADFYQATTTSPLGPKFTVTYDKVRGEIVVKNIITSDAKSDLIPTSYVIERGKSIEIIYKDRSPLGTIPANFTKNYEMTHRFTVTKIGMGTGSKLQGLVRYIYPDPSMGVTKDERFSVTPL